MEPALSIVRSLGGPTKVGLIVNLSTSAVSKWWAPLDKGGCGGLIPSRHVGALVRAARAAGKFLEPNMFFAGHL